MLILGEFYLLKEIYKFFYIEFIFEIIFRIIIYFIEINIKDF